MFKNKWLNAIPIVALVLVIGVIVYFQMRPPQEELGYQIDLNPIIAIVNGEEIRYLEYAPYLGFWSMIYGYSMEEASQDIEIYNYLMEGFLRDKLQVEYLLDMGLTYDEEELDTELFYALYQLFEDEEDQANKEDEYGFNEETIRHILMGYLLDDSYTRALIDEIIETYTEEELQELYLEYQDYFFNSDAGVSVSHILVETEEEAQAALDRLHSGEDFALLAMEISIDYSSAVNGGKLTPFTVESNLVPEFIEASFALSEPGEISDIVPSYHGFHIIKLHTAYEEGSVLNFDDAKGYLPYIVADDIRSAEFEDLWYFADIEYPAYG